MDMSDSSEPITVKVTLPAGTVEDIKTLSSKLGISAGEFLRRAVGREKYLTGVEQNHGSVLIETADKQINRLVPTGPTGPNRPVR